MLIGDGDAQRAKLHALKAHRGDGTRHYELPAPTIHQVAHQAAGALDVDEDAVALQAAAGHGGQMDDGVELVPIELAQILERVEVATNGWQIQPWIGPAHADYVVLCRKGCRERFADEATRPRHENRTHSTPPITSE